MKRLNVRINAVLSGKPLDTWERLSGMFLSHPLDAIECPSDAVVFRLALRLAERQMDTQREPSPEGPDNA